MGSGMIKSKTKVFRNNYKSKQSTHSQNQAYPNLRTAFHLFSTAVSLAFWYFFFFFFKQNMMLIPSDVLFTEAWKPQSFYI